MGVNGIFVKQYFSKKIVEKNGAMALFQSIYGNWYRPQVLYSKTGKNSPKPDNLCPKNGNFEKNRLI
jgi:hypothetical protein